MFPQSFQKFPKKIFHGNLMKTQPPKNHHHEIFMDAKNPHPQPHP